MLLQFPKRGRHARASSAATGRKKASIGTSLPESSVSLLARPRDASFRPAQMLRKCHSEHPTDVAIAGTVIPWRSAQTSMGCVSDMGQSISTRNIESQPQIFPQEIVNWENDLVEFGMGKSQTKRRPPPPPATNPDLEPLYVGDWIDRLGFVQKDVVKETGISQGYISNMSGGRRNNPSSHKLRKIAAVLKISTDDFYRPAPPKEHLQALWGLSDAAKAALLRAGKKDDK